VEAHTPIRSYFEWHDAKCLARARDPRKNQNDVRLLRVMRVPLFLGILFIFVLLSAAVVLAVMRSDSVFEHSILEDSIPVLAVMLPLFLFFYAWVTEALLFRRYIDEHGAKS
jgi:hypothetical protein